MKKYLLFFTSAALLLVGCAKEQIVDLQEGELTNVTFTANVDNGATTKALADNDGKGASVNRCIMEIYYGDTFYKRLVQDVTPAAGEAKAYATFANVPVVAGKEYTVLFWADCGGDNNADKYYTTTSLKTVTVAKEAFIGALAAGKNDELDAFYLGDKYTITQGGVSKDVTLKRPFAQLNVITTDVAANKAVISEGLLPDAVKVSYTAYNTFNVADSTASGSTTYSYEAPVYGNHNTWSDVKNHGELTLSMDYVLAAADKGAIDVEFKIKNDGTDVLTHNLTNLPYQRNYRTNVKGDLLTVGGTWTATIEPTWSTPDYDVPYYVASSIADARNYISSSNTEQAKSVDLTKATINQSDVNGEDGTIHFVLMTTSPQDLVNFTLPAIPQGIAQGWTIEYEDNYPTKNVGVNAPEGTKVKILAPTSHVNVTGTSYTEITALTGDNTLVIPQGVTVASLIIQKGAVEIHGTVTNLSVNPAAIADTDPVQYEKVVFRACEGLSADVFAAIKGEDHDYIDPRYCAVEKATTPNTYDIVLATVATIGEKEYVTLAAAVAAVKNGETITLIKDVVLDKPIETNKTFTLTLNADITPVSGWQTNDNTTDALVIINRGGNITINGTGKISSDGIKNAYAAVKLTNKGESETGAAAKLTVDGDVTLEGYYYGICGNGSRHDTEITVNGGTIKGMATNDNVGIYHPQKGKLTINGGTIEGASGIYVKSGDVEASINAGTIKGVGTNCKQYNPNRTGDGCDATGDAFVVDNCGYPGGEPTVEILGGTFISENYEAVGSYAKTGYPTVKSFIKGGTFSSDPWKYCAKGYASIEQDGKWIIVNAPKADVIKVHPDPDMAQTIPTSITGTLAEHLFYKSESQTSAGIPIPSVKDGRMELADDYNNVVDVTNGLSSITSIGNLNGLDVCYIFAAKCGQGEESDGTNGEFDDWNADFVVSLDKEVNKDEIGLWGYYSIFGALAFKTPEYISAGTEIELLGWATNGGQSNWKYSDIKSIVNVFPCGAFKLSDNIKDATIKVDLRIFDPNDHSKYFVIESYEYKFTNETNAVIQ